MKKMPTKIEGCKLCPFLRDAGHRGVSEGSHYCQLMGEHYVFYAGYSPLFGCPLEDCNE